MDRLTRFNTAISGVITVSSEGGNSLDNVVAKLGNLLDEAKLLRAGHEEWTWGEMVKEGGIDLDDLDLEEVDG